MTMAACSSDGSSNEISSAEPSITRGVERAKFSVAVISVVQVILFIGVEIQGRYYMADSSRPTQNGYGNWMVLLVFYIQWCHQQSIMVVASDQNFFSSCADMVSELGRDAKDGVSC